MSHLRDSMDTPFSTVTDRSDPTNPKDRIGERKVGLSYVPPVALLLFAHAMMEGAKKYGPYNWREKKVQANIYVDAALRHILLWASGEEIDPESGKPHLGHAGACLAIIIDAQCTGNLIDNRFKDAGFGIVLRAINEELKNANLSRP